MTAAVPSQNAFARVRFRPLPLVRFQLWACEAIIVAYFLSIWKYKIWLITTLGASVLTAFVVILSDARVRGLLRDLWPLVLYFAYLIAASTQSEYASEAGWWAAVDSIGILVAALFWVAARNSEPSAIRSGFINVSLLAAVVAICVDRSFPEASRLGGYALPFYPIAIPFLWAEIIGGKRKRSAWLALTVVLAILMLSRSRTPLAAGLLVLGLSFVWIGRSLMQRFKLGLMITIVVTLVGIALMSFGATRFALLTFVARVTHEDIITKDYYIPGEAFDPTRSYLDAIFSEKIIDAQPFGIGYTTTGRYYELAWGSYTPLHSMYQTWALEGGVFCVLIMTGILIRHWLALRRARHRAASYESEILARCVTLATVAMLFIGLFHQMHQGPLFYAVLGMALGLRQHASSNGSSRGFARRTQ